VGWIELVEMRRGRKNLRVFIEWLVDRRNIKSLSYTLFKKNCNKIITKPNKYTVNPPTKKTKPCEESHNSIS
jgi:hypothetical protein